MRNIRLIMLMTLIGMVGGILPLFAENRPLLPVDDTPRVISGESVSEPVDPQKASDHVSQLKKLSELKSHLRPGDSDSRLALALWAQQQGLHREAIDLANEAVDIDPESDQAYTKLLAIASDARFQPDPKLEQQLLLELGPGFAIHYAPHYVVAYKADRSWSAARSALLERTHDVFYDTYRRAGYRLRPLRQPMIGVLFGDHANYLKYAQEVDKADMGWAAGYYSSRTNRVAFFDDRDSPAFRQAVVRMQKLELINQEIRSRITQSSRSNDRRALAHYRQALQDNVRELNWYRNRHNALAKLGNVAKTTHEAVHQLSFNSGLQYRHLAYPLWYSEGIATQFETDDPAKPFGPYHDNDMRMNRIRDMLNHDRWIPLQTFVSELRPDMDDEAKLADWYAQSWAVYQYLFRAKRDDLRQYTETLNRRKPNERPDAATLKKEFQDQFGDLDQLDRLIQTHFRARR